MRWLMRIAIISGLGILLAGCLFSPDNPAAKEVGQPAPDISGPDLHGQPLRLRDYRGKVVLLDFWMHT